MCNMMKENGEKLHSKNWVSYRHILAANVFLFRHEENIRNDLAGSFHSWRLVDAVLLK